MNPAEVSAAPGAAADVTDRGTAAPALAAAPAVGAGLSRWVMGMGIVGLLASAVALTLSYSTSRRLQAFEQELARRQQSSQEAASEARVLARQAQDAARESTARMALLEARVAESALQRSQLEDLIQSLSRSRDENVLSDTEAALRVAMQQSAITGGPEPLVAALRQAEERLARVNQPRLERVRRAVARDLDRVRAANVADVGTLTLRLDEVTRLVDELPLVSSPERRLGGPESVGAGPRAAPAAPAAASVPAAHPNTWDALQTQLRSVLGLVWGEVRSLVRLTRIDQPEAMLVAPEQALFLRENLKLRLLNARLALLSRQFELAQADLREAEAVLARHFDRESRRVLAASEQVRQVGALLRGVSLPRPDETLAALATASAGR